MRLFQGESDSRGPSELAEGEMVLVATAEELQIIVSMISETLEAVESWEFQTRLGITRDEAKAFSDEIWHLYNEDHLP